MGVPQKWMVYNFTMENPTKIGDLGYPYFRKPPIYPPIYWKKIGNCWIVSVPPKTSQGGILCSLFSCGQFVVPRDVTSMGNPQRTARFADGLP